eukprot:48816-Eustigmatos_ZCMA.PRE.1
MHDTRVCGYPNIGAIIGRLSFPVCPAGCCRQDRLPEGERRLPMLHISHRHRPDDSGTAVCTMQSPLKIATANNAADGAEPSLPYTLCCVCSPLLPSSPPLR